MRYPAIILLIIGLWISTGGSPAAQASITPELEQTAVGQTPPRLSFVDGQVSFWRPGAQEWTQAQLNMPLAPGDQLYTGSPGNLELQIGSRAFVRGWANTQIGLENREPDFLQFGVTTGHAAFDLRTLEPGRTVTVDTPNAVFTIDHAGYYRIDVNGDRTSFITRRGGRATVTPASGESFTIAPSEGLVIDGTASPKITFYTAPQLDEWDQWNYARTDHLLETVSSRYVSPEIYGVGDLDPYGTWRITPAYGPVWVPTAVATGWVPYSTGAWILDPYYGWTWVDTAPWGWAPYHYGRWVFVDGFWGWAPGPVLVRPVYAPALVAFFGGSGFSASVAIGGGPLVGWVALGWGEPLVPWWGTRGFIHRPWWGGWGGPRVVNNVVITKTTVVNIQNITVYRNAGVPNALVAVDKNHFGRGPIKPARIARVDIKQFRPIHTAPKIKATPASFKPVASRGIRPPEKSLKRPVVANRPVHTQGGQDLASKPNRGQNVVRKPAPRFDGAPKQGEVGPAQPLPSSQQTRVKRLADNPADRSVASKIEDPRRVAERQSKAAPPVNRQLSLPTRSKPQAAAPATQMPQLQAPRRSEGPQNAKVVPKIGPSATRQASSQSRREPQVTAPGTVRPQLRDSRPEDLRPQARRLPGDPATQLSPNRVKGQNMPRASLKAAPQGRIWLGKP